MVDATNTSTAPVLVFGATGRVGSNIVKQLIDKSVPVAAAVRSIDKAKSKLPQSPHLQLVQADLTDTASLREAVQQTKATRTFIYVIDQDGKYNCSVTSNMLYCI